MRRNPAARAAEDAPASSLRGMDEPGSSVLPSPLRDIPAFLRFIEADRAQDFPRLIHDVEAPAAPVVLRGGILRQKVAQCDEDLGNRALDVGGDDAGIIRQYNPAPYEVEEAAHSVTPIA